MSKSQDKSIDTSYMDMGVKIPSSKIVKSVNVGSSSKPKKPRVKMQSLKQEIKQHMYKLQNDLR